MKLKLLFVEDHQALLKNLAEFFTADKYETDFASDGLNALHLLSTNTYDAVILDVMLPGVNGLTICARIRNDLHSSVPVILLTALDAIENKIDGFGVGANDYLCKPFDMRELELRIHSLCKQKNVFSGDISAGDLIFNPRSLVASYHDKKMNLSGLSANLLEALIRSFPNYLSYEDISECLWGISEIDENTIRTHVYNLRKQLKNIFGKSMIKGIYGRGYQLDPEGD